MGKNTESKNRKLYKALEPIARKAVRCNACFNKDSVLQKPFVLERPKYVNLAQPRHIGEDYLSHRIAFIMINPGVGNKEEAGWQEALKDFKEEKMSLEDLFADEKHRDLPSEWVDGGIEKFIDLHGLKLENIALVNIAWCAAKGNAHPSWMLRKCFKRHTSKWLKELTPRPSVVILSGLSDVAPFKDTICSLLQLPSDNVLPAYHYAYWQRNGKAKEDAETKAEEVKNDLKELGVI